MASENSLDFKIPKQTLNSKNSKQKELVPKIIAYFLWFLFVCNLAYLSLNFNSLPDWKVANLLRINSFSILIWTTVTFFSAIVSSFASKYLSGFIYHKRFMLLSLLFTSSVMLLVISDNVFLFIFSWLAMGFFMAQLIGIDKNWGEAREASKYAQKFFLLGASFLTIGLLIIALNSGVFTLSKLSFIVSNLPIYVTIPSALFVIAAALVQSAIYPFHRWLLSAMTSPTPASALMHAGFVNGSGILLAFFASLLFASNMLNVLFIIGGLTAIIAQFTKLLQVNVKQKLACSTIAQMGFMIMQCGLGFFNAAVVHLILHGFYKSYLFLSSGEEIAQTKPENETDLKIKPLQIIPVALFGFLGAFLFATWTGKGLQMDSGVFLTIIVAITVGQATYNIIKVRSLSLLQKIIVPPFLFITGIGLYALLYNGVTILMSDMPMTNQPLPLSSTQIIFNIIFLIGFFIMKLGSYKKIPWLYVKLMNMSQPYKKSVLMFKSKTV
uniref:proton-conducting transporter transmembrane domain-containing protein n=1 Tax=Flavobacterium sp. TaxID=239 RepID=UPI00404A4596